MPVRRKPGNKPDEVVSKQKRYLSSTRSIFRVSESFLFSSSLRCLSLSRSLSRSRSASLSRSLSLSLARCLSSSFLLSSSSSWSSSSSFLTSMLSLVVSSRIRTPASPLWQRSCREKQTRVDVRRERRLQFYHSVIRPNLPYWSPSVFPAASSCSAARRPSAAGCGFEGCWLGVAFPCWLVLSEERQKFQCASHSSPPKPMLEHIG